MRRQIDEATMTTKGNFYLILALIRHGGLTRQSPGPDLISPFVLPSMHAQLSDKKIVCKEFIEALERCHATGWKRLTGACNSNKDVLNKCLRAERIDRTAKNAVISKERRLKAEKALKEFHELDS